MRIWRRSVLALGAVLLIVFAAGVFAGQMLVQKISPISSGEVPVTPAPLRIMKVSWKMNMNSSTVEAVSLNVTNTENAMHGFQLAVQVSCLSSTGRAFFCANGGASFTMFPLANATVLIALNPALQPARTLIQSLSFVVIETDSVRLSFGTIISHP